MKSDRKQTILFIIILLVLSMGIGYAFLTTTLTIDGVSDIDAVTYDVHFENIQIHEDSFSGANVITPATISADGKSISFHVKLGEPGDFYGFDVDVVNDGTIPVIIEDIVLNYNGRNYYYSNFDEDDWATNGTPNYVWIYQYESSAYGFLDVGARLEPGETKGTGFGTQYVRYIDPEDLPTEDTSATVTYSFIFSQAESGYYSYSASGVDFSIYDPFNMPSGMVEYKTPQEAINNFNNNDIFIRYRNNSGTLKELQVGFKYNNRFYYMAPFVDDYIHNRNLLLSLFGDEKCTLNADYFKCYHVMDDYYFEINRNNGFIHMGKSGGNHCLVSLTETSASARCGDFLI